MASDLEYRILARLDELESHMSEIVSSCDTADTATGDRQRLLRALAERLASLADDVDEGGR